ncbi:hypothetical protein M3589_07135 [Heyndrickxia oleronia]|uniref:DUF4309 domain-containing protein n=1 Tax=Heyndrickxia oleronia TaxID=38875 RepID=UPI00203D1D23|nr:DUF4309 domain-containing protein [Heyndrickxia oleronia]MCM3237496.1 hypothetical protein [Heyndrickxia oleronia]
MKLAKFIVLICLTNLLLGACSSKPMEKKEEPSSSKKSGFVLNNKMVDGLKQGKIIDTPLDLSKVSTMADVEKVWGKPDEAIDHQDLQDYIYIKNGQRIMITENIEEEQVQYKFSFSISIATNRDEILKKMGKPKDVHATTILQYYYNGYKIQFEKNDKNNWLVYLAKSI